jgi:hypothetical protein
VLYEQPPTDTGELLQSSWAAPDTSDFDMYAYDDFTLAADADIAEVSWRGGYMLGGLYGTATDFTVTFFDSIAGDSQPNVANPRTTEIFLADFATGGPAGETFVGAFGGNSMYDYHFTLPTPFHATAGVKYWIRVEAAQVTHPDWGICLGTGGNGSYFRFLGARSMFQTVPGSDLAFTLR